MRGSGDAVLVRRGEVRSGVSPDPDRGGGERDKGVGGGLLDPDWIERGGSGATARVSIGWGVKGVCVGGAAGP